VTKKEVRKKYLAKVSHEGIYNMANKVEDLEEYNKTQKDKLD
jgi:hypothetical protein